MDVFYDLVRIRLSPIASRAAGVGHATEVSAVDVRVYICCQLRKLTCTEGCASRTVGLHVTVGTPCIGVDLRHTS